MTECTSLDAQPNASAFKRWLSVISLAFGTFVLINTEFLPIGLLTPIAHSLNVSEGRAGLAVMLPGLAAAASAILLLLFSRQLNRRTLLLFLSAMVILSNAAAMLAPSFGVLLIGRIILGVAVGGFWSFAIPAAMRAIKSAVAGAIRTRSAHLPSSICPIDASAAGSRRSSDTG